MKLIESKAEYIPQEEGLEGIYKQIELAGRTAYHSLDKITPDSAKDFVDRMIRSKHGAALEAGTVYLFYSVSCYNREGQKWISKYESNPYSKVICVGVDDNEPAEDGNYYDLIGNKACGNEQYVVTTNYRVLQENNWLDDLQYLCSPTEFHEKRYTFKLTTSIGVTRELNRHRVNSIAEQSTRYCNYSKGKFGGEVAVIIPEWCKGLVAGNSYNLEIAEICGESEGIEPLEQDFIKAACAAENFYMQYIVRGWKPQQAREVLPLCTATEIIHTAFASDWRHFFDLRLFGKTGAPHPNMLHLAELMQAEAIKAGIWEDIMSKPSKFE